MKWFGRSLLGGICNSSILHCEAIEACGLALAIYNTYIHLSATLPDILDCTRPEAPRLHLLASYHSSL